MDKVAVGRELPPIEGEGKHRTLPRLGRGVILVMFLIGLGVTILQIFFVVSMFTNFYLYLLLAMFLPPVFMFYGVNRNATKGSVPWYDIILAVTTFAIFIYLMMSAFEITNRGWAFGAPTRFNILCFIIVPISLEAVRRLGGNVLCAFSAFFAAYPLFAEDMPGLLAGASFSLSSVLNYHILSTDSVLGLPLQVVGTLVVGYLIFGVVMTFTGGGKFFLDIAFSLFGAQSGGPAKVAVISSGLFGSLSGSVISNVLTTGAFTIPAMKKAGYAPHYAAAVEACASTGGCLAPPVMGAVAFVMASILQIPYWDVVKAAAIPALLYYWALFMQVHCYAHRKGLRGMDKSQLPKIGPVLKSGWPYLLALGVLVFFIYQQKEGEAPFYASIVLLAVSIIKRDVKVSVRNSLELIEQVGLMVVDVTAVLVACGYILGAFSMTGLGSSFSREIVLLAGNTPILLLICGALASYILGMGMTITASYIFLAAILAPALVDSGFSMIAAHLFVLYWGLSSFITPPVAIGAYVAAGLAGANAMRTGYTAMRLGMVLYVVPFVFVYEPAIVLDAPLVEIPRAVLSAVVGLALVAGSFEGYMVWFQRVSVVERVLLLFAGGMFLWPFSFVADLVGLGVVVAMVAFRRWRHGT